MKEITEEQAQQIANITGCTITQDRYAGVNLWDDEFEDVEFDHCINENWYSPCDIEGCMKLPISIDTLLQNDKQIWRPK